MLFLYLVPMNYLAHIYLSGNDTGIILGNFIADGIKGQTYKKYPDSIQKGILLHRAIDSFTDSHPIVRQSTARLHKTHGHFSGVVVDVLYDHFLAKNWRDYSTIPLEIYIQQFYTLLQDNYAILPEKIQKMMPAMLSENWLLSYQSKQGISIILNKMYKRIKRETNLNFAILDLEKYYHEFEEDFRLFFEEIRTFVIEKLSSYE